MYDTQKATHQPKDCYAIHPFFSAAAVSVSGSAEYMDNSAKGLAVTLLIHNTSDTTIFIYC
jgi:hypothetical protein